MKKIYCLSGLGADERIFRRLSVENVQFVHLKWAPHKACTSVKEYATRMSASIPDPEPIIIGLSFGGMLATEIAKLRPVKKVFLISSAKTKHELPDLPGVLSLLIDSNIVPSFFYSIPNPYISYLFDAKTKEERQLLNSIIRDSDGAFVKWALNAIRHWDNETIPRSIVHIHGTNDKVLPSAKSVPDHWIEGGGHMMVYNRADEINAILNKELNP